MYLISENFYYNIHGTVKELNRLGVSRWVFQFGETINIDKDMVTVVVFRFESYPDYVYYCEKRDTIPMTTKEFYG